MMSKAMIVIGPDHSMLKESAEGARNRLTWHTNLSIDDIDLIYASSSNNSSCILGTLSKRLDLQKEDEPLMVIYIGFGNSEGWEFQQNGITYTVLYTDLAKLLGKYQFPIHFVNACYYSTSAVPAFKKLLNGKKQFGIITPYAKSEVGWEGHFLEVRLMFFFDLHIPYDHGVWNEHSRDLLFGFYPKKPGVGWDKKAKCMRFVVNGKAADKNLTADGTPARHGKVLDHHFWTFQYDNMEEYFQNIEKYLKKSQRAKKKRQAMNLNANKGAKHFILQRR